MQRIESESRVGIDTKVNNTSVPTQNVSNAGNRSLRHEVEIYVSCGSCFTCHCWYRYI